MSLFKCPECNEESDHELVLIDKNIRQNYLNGSTFNHDFQEWLENGKVGNSPKEKKELPNAKVTCLHCGYVYEFTHNHIVKKQDIIAQ